MGQYQPMVTIWISLVGPVLNAAYRFKIFSLSSPEKKIFKRFLQYMSMANILIIWPKTHEQIFIPQSYM